MARVRRNASKLHIQTLEALEEMFPNARIKQEYKIRGEETKNLWLDFYIPSVSLAVEVQGEQHFRFNDFHYKTKLDFINQIKRDDEKEVWCTKNGVTLITVNYDEEITSDLIWEKIEKARGGWESV